MFSKIAVTVEATAPLRLPIAGGGTDLPFFYSKYGAKLVTLALDLPVTVEGRRSTRDQVEVAYPMEGDRTREGPCAPVAIRHPLWRGVLSAAGAKSFIGESRETMLSGKGLGSSGAFSLAALAVLFKLRGTQITCHHLAETACRVEMELLSRGTGKQDAYASAYGGLAILHMSKAGVVEVERFHNGDFLIRQLERHLLLADLGGRHDSGRQFEFEARASASSLIDNLQEVSALAESAVSCLGRGELSALGKLFTQQWQLKLERQPSKFHEKVHELVVQVCRAGAWGAKLVGSGGAGFMCIVVSPRCRSAVAKVLSDRAIACSSVRAARGGLKIRET